jgi:hypothetical protein
VERLELELRACDKRCARLGDKSADDRARGLDAPDEPRTLAANNEQCFSLTGRNGLVEFGEHWCRVDLDLVYS